RRGDDNAAATYLEEIVQRAPAHDPRKGMAALSLVRLILREDPRRAAAILDEALPSMPEALMQDALARRVEAAALAGEHERARQLARQYLARFPNGHRSEDVKRWLEP